MLTKKLKELAQSNIYPFHMPGHKRQMHSEWNPYAIDITEIDGFDNLHHAKGVIKQAQDRAATLYGAKNSYFLVNGSTCGIHVAISAVVGKRKRILVARNCHKAVYHTIFLQELSPIYLYPRMTEAGIQGQIIAKDVEEKLNQYSDIAAVMITSPTYDGVVSDVESIAKIAHAHGIPLIVDEAHGAHFGFSPQFPVSAVRLGADLVIQSLHKTLPSFTQTAILHLCTDRVSKQMITRYLDIFETTSPSYVLMVGMNDCIQLLTSKKNELFSSYWNRLQDFYGKIKELRHLKVLKKEDFTKQEAFDFDASKILIFTQVSNFSGKDLYDLLLSKYELQMEMASGNYVVAMTSIMDTKEGLDRLANALLAIDATLRASGEDRRKLAKGMEQIYARYDKVCEIYEALTYPTCKIALQKAIGETVAEYIYLYPPGIPLLTPGERITDKLVRDIQNALQLGLTIYGIASDETIEVVNFR